jgi:hypothetical protein
VGAKIISSKEENSEEQNQQSEEIKTLEYKKSLAETQKAIAEAQKATVEALIPASKLQPQEGKTEADEKFGYVTELVAYQVLKEQAKEIGKEIDAKLDPQKKHKVLIVDELDFATEDLSLVHLEALFKLFQDSISKQLDENKKIKEKVLPAIKGVLPAAILAVSGIVGVVADIIGYFKTDYNIKGREVNLKDHAIFANVLSSITKVPVQIFKFHLIEKSEILSNFKALLDQKTQLDTSLAMLKTSVTKKLTDDIEEAKQVVSRLEVALEKLTTETEIRKEIEEKVKANKKSMEEKNALLVKTNAAILATETLLTAISNFAESATKTPEDKSPPLLLKAALRKHIRTEGFTHLLNLKILSAGGEAVTMQQRIGKSGKLIFIGGCAISYILVQTDGTYIIANTHHGLAHLNYDLGKAQESLKVQPINTLSNSSKKT